MKSILGIDIGTSQIKIVESSISGKTAEIVKVCAFPNISRGIFSETQKDQEELARSMKTALKDAGISIRSAHVSLHESLIYTRIITMPLLSDKELVQALKWEAERYIPLPLDEVEMDSVIISRNPDLKQMEVLLVASPTRLVERYTKVFGLAGISVDSMENESLPLLRLFQKPNENFLLVDIGDVSTTLLLLRGDGLVMVRTTGIGGGAYTKAIATEFNLALPQAEEYKKTYGIAPSGDTERLMQIILPLLGNLVSDINQSLTFFKQKYQNEIISRIVLLGGGSLLPGLAQYISDSVQLETVVANPWQVVTVNKHVSAEQNKSVIYSVATGLAIRDKQ